MINNEIRSLKVAVIQMESINGSIDYNLDRATKFVEQAVAQKAELIVFPEFMPTGYIMAKDIWHTAEPKEGPTVKWLKICSKKYGVWICTTYLEAEGKDFYNTFVLTSPNGKEAGRVRKNLPALFEAYFFRGQSGSHIINTEIGKIGVAICSEGYLYNIAREMFDNSVDILLMPHSAPTPTKSFFLTDKFLRSYNNMLKESSQRMSLLLGIPSVMSNKCGIWQSPMPGLNQYQDSSFPGFSTITDFDGTVKGQLCNEEGVLVKDIYFNSSRKTKTPPKSYGTCGMFSLKLPLLYNLLGINFLLGSLSYFFNSERKKRAMEISCGDHKRKLRGNSSAGSTG